MVEGREFHTYRLDDIVGIYYTNYQVGIVGTQDMTQLMITDNIKWDLKVKRKRGFSVIVLYM